MDTPIMSDKYKKSQWPLYAVPSIIIAIGVLFLITGIQLNNVLVYGTYIVGFSIILTVLSKLDTFKSVQKLSPKELSVKNNHQELMAENAKMKNDLSTVLEQPPKMHTYDTIINGSTKPFMPSAVKKQIAYNHKQLEGNQSTLEMIEGLKLTLQNSNDSLQAKQIEYLLKLDELESRLVINENGIKLI